jgi:hypothetical protein
MKSCLMHACLSAAASLITREGQQSGEDPRGRALCHRAPSLASGSKRRSESLQANSAILMPEGMREARRLSRRTNAYKSHKGMPIRCVP